MSELPLEVITSGDRLDRYLSEHLPDLSRSRLQKLISQGHVTINGDICTTKKTILKAQDLIIVTIPDLETLSLEPEAIPLDILYEDGELIIINKPSDLVVHPAPGHYHGTLVNAILHHCQDLAGIGGVERPGIVHRLDKDTTGAIVVAKTDHAHRHLQQQIKDRVAKREYIAIVHGCPRDLAGTIEQPLARHPVHRQKIAIDPDGRPARTHWQIKENFGNYSLLQFQLDTGRTHQIRVHIAHLGHPIVGDPLYSAGRSVGVNLTGQALHAEKLTLVHPITDETITAIAPWPGEFKKLHSVLNHRHQASLKTR
ncbi:MAG: RluA family pseudouridine synthase [Synechococcaceae cyanobacterium RL_1_2]|nr:RluA family pseudouridine synthase [Synechococcaceae cyanobacterium RL_1_2]